MRETRTSGSVEGVLSNEHPYSDCGPAGCPGSRVAALCRPASFLPLDVIQVTGLWNGCEKGVTR